MGFYGLFTYGSDYYGLSGFPTSVPWDVYDFCEPTDATMMTLFSYPEVSSARTFGPPHMQFDVDNDLVLLSDDDDNSGFTVDVPMGGRFTIQFSFKPTQLPPDFSDPGKRFFVAGYNMASKMVGLLFSEDGIALAATGTSAYTVFADSADLFDEGSDYYTIRFTCDANTNVANLFVTRQDLVPIIGHQLRYTFTPLDTPDALGDHTAVEVYGSAVDPTEISLDCWRLASTIVMPNQRPIAVPGPDQTQILGGYGGFDGRGSYDPDGDLIVKYWWTATGVPSGSGHAITGSGDTPADGSGYTNILQGSSGDFADVRVGDLLYVDGSGSVIKYVGDDYLVAIDHVFTENVTGVSWEVIKQDAWGGAYVDGVVTHLLGAQDTPPVSPDDGDAYLVEAVATGAWVGQEDRIATWDALGTAWVFTSPSDEDLVYVIDDYSSRKYINGDYPAGQWEFIDPLPWELSRWTGREISIGTFLPELEGLYTHALLVRDNGSPAMNSLPAEVLLNVNATSVPFGYVPDMGWIWNYLPDMWELVSDKDKIDTVWSAFTQVAAGLMLELWQHDYGKAILDIQRIFQKRWLAYDALYEEPNYDTIPAEINNAVELAGYSAAPGTNEYSYETGVSLAGVTSSYLLVLDGVGYRITGVTATAVIVKDAIPTTDRPVFWQIKPTVTSAFSNFDEERCESGDAAIFEVVDPDGNSSEYAAYVYGVKWGQVCFDDTSIAGFLGDDTYTVRFKGVLRRTAMRINEYIVGVPQLREVINTEAIDGAPDPLWENLNYIVGEEAVSGTGDVNTLRFRDAWFEVVVSGTDGDTSAGPQYLDSATSDFEQQFGVGADLSGYVLELPSGRYRLYQVISATRIELEEEALASDTGLRWSILSISDPPEHLWAEATYVDNRPTIEANFGRLVGFRVEDLATRTDDLDYLSAVRGLWYTYCFGPTVENLRIGSQILLGLPFAEVSGTITDIADPFDATRTRVLIRDASNDSIVRSYFYPTSLGLETNPATGSPYALGDTVEQFAPLCQGVTVTDHIKDEDWFADFKNSGDFFEAWKVHTFGIIVDADAFDLTNLEFVMSYVLKIKPTYTYPWFVVAKSLQDIITPDDDIALGPVSPYDMGADAYYGYPDDWDPFPIPPGWVVSPWEKTTRIVTPTYDITTRWPNNRYVGAPPNTEHGNLPLFDTPGRVPDGWTGAFTEGDGKSHVATRAEGAHIFGDTDQSGHCIHVFGAHKFAADLSTDGDMELSDVTNWPDITGHAPGTKQKVLTPVYAGTRSLEISDAGSFLGAYQDFPAAIDRGFQVGVTAKVWVASGQARFRLRDQNVPVTGSNSSFSVSASVVTFTAGSSVFTADMVGWEIDIAGATSPGNDGAFIIASYISGTQVTFVNPLGVTEAGAGTFSAASYIAEDRFGARLEWVNVVLHAWAVADDSNAVRFEMSTGPAGGQFYVDDVKLYTKLMPWDQWGFGRMLSGRTGGYTQGSSPDEYLTLQIVAGV